MFAQLAELKLNGWSCERRVIVERTLKPLNPSPQGSFWKQRGEDFSAYVTNLTIISATPKETDAFQIVQLYRQRADTENAFHELKNDWGFAGFCSQKAAVSQSSVRMLLLVYNLWSLFVRVLSGRRRIVKLAVAGKFASFLKKAYHRLKEWLSRTAPQLSLSMGKAPPVAALRPNASLSVSRHLTRWHHHPLPNCGL